MSAYKLDGVDMHTGYGFRVAAGSDDFLAMAASKDKPTFSWPDDVTEFDLSAPAFHPKEAILTGTLIAGSEVDFWNKWGALRAVLQAPGERILEIVELAKSFRVFYMSQPESRRLTPIKGSTRIGYHLAIQLMVMGFADGSDPEPNGGFVNIVNQYDDVLATVQAPGEYEVLMLSGIYDDGNGEYPNSIIDTL